MANPPADQIQINVNNQPPNQMIQQIAKNEIRTMTLIIKAMMLIFFSKAVLIMLCLLLRESPTTGLLSYLIIQMIIDVNQTKIQFNKLRKLKNPEMYNYIN
jgi:hypothetical protein